jgi:hypothetical protein
MTDSDIAAEFEALQQDVNDIKKNITFLYNIVNQLCEWKLKHDISSDKELDDEKAAKNFLLKQVDHS